MKTAVCGETALPSQLMQGCSSALRLLRCRRIRSSVDPFLRDPFGPLGRWRFSPARDLSFILRPLVVNCVHMNWFYFALITVVSWGLYGVFLHSGNLAMDDPVFGRYKAFLVVGIAYVIVAVLAPIVLLKVQGGNFVLSPRGFWLSLIAGTLGAIGALGALLAFGAKGSPAAVMSIVFAGAPMVNAIVAISLHPPQGGVTAVPWQFVLGILLAATGGCLIMLFKPPPAKIAAAPVAQVQSADSGLE